MSARGVAAVLLATLTAVLAAGGCSREERAEPPGTRAAAMDTTPAAPGDLAGSASRRREPGSADGARYRLLLVNRDTATLIIRASSGREEVVLDTVPGGDSARVDVMLAADTLHLRALDAAALPGAEPLAEESIVLRADTLTRWVLP